MLQSCDNDEPDTRQLREVHLVLGAQTYSDITITHAAAPGTRALPDGFVTYSELYPQGLPEYAQIYAYLAKAGSNPPETGLFAYEDISGTRTWSSHINIDAGETYYIYGFMPKEDAGNITITPYTNPNDATISGYQHGAVMTINGLNAVTPADVCVIVGVRGNDNNTDAITSLDMASRLGKFDYTTQDAGDYVYLLIDHLYCGLNFEMKVDAAYNALRTIKVKQLKLIANNGSSTVKKVNAVVTLVANQTYSGTQPLNPLSDEAGGSISFTTAETGDDVEPAMLWNDATNPKVLSTEKTSFLGCFAPATNRNYILESTYDIYDRKGNLIRANCTAQNAFTAPSGMKPGQNHTYQITVNPTYLYMLSDPDLDNPVFTLE